MKFFIFYLSALILSSLADCQTSKQPVLSISSKNKSICYSYNYNSDSTKYDITGEKSAWIAFGLSYLFPGAGQVYNGQPIKGLLFLTGITAGVGIALLGYPGADFETTRSDKALFYSGRGLSGLLFVAAYRCSPNSFFN